MDTLDFTTPDQTSSEPPDGESVNNEKQQSQQAADLIRKKLAGIYNHEPSAEAEVKEVKSQRQPYSKHQQYIFELSNSGRSVAEIQTAWHEYYQSLNENEKREVWDEFYSQQQPPAGHVRAVPSIDNTANMSGKHEPGQHTSTPNKKHKSYHSHSSRTVADYKHHIAQKSGVKRKLSAKHHIQSLIFGVGVGAFVVLLLLFGFFNERFIAPFITPSRQVNSTPIISDPNSTSVSQNPQIIIPKINVDIPVVYDVPTIAETAVESGLERGVVHYATTPLPGQKGNVVIFGHSSNNIFNPGKYKFAFVLLSRLENGDLFYLDKNEKRYVYRVYKKRVVEPTEIEVLDTADKPDTATLITCDPPGTSLRRLVVTGEQISPSPKDNSASTIVKSTDQPNTIPSNSISLWQRFVNWL